MHIIQKYLVREGCSLNKIKISKVNQGILKPKGCDVVIYFEDVCNAIRNVCGNYLSDGICLSSATKILRNDLLREYPKLGYF